MSRRGVTLIELVIMIAVASVLFVGLARGYQSLIRRAVDNRNYMIALNLAKKQMAILNNTAYASLANSTTSDASFPGFSIVTTVTANSPIASMTNVRVDVTSGGSTYVRLVTYRDAVVTFGTGS